MPSFELIAAPHTPFFANGDLALNVVAQQAAYLRDKGVHGVLKALEQRGLIRFSYGRITVPDPDALKAYLDERAG